MSATRSRATSAGARAFGFQALLLDRQARKWCLPGLGGRRRTTRAKSAADIENGTVRSLADVVALVEMVRARRGAGNVVVQ